MVSAEHLKALTTIVETVERVAKAINIITATQAAQNQTIALQSDYLTALDKRLKALEAREAKCSPPF